MSERIVMVVVGTVQALAACVLVGITWVYVRHTKILAEQAQRQATDERRLRQESAIQAVRCELLDIVRSSSPEQARRTPVRLPTFAWESMKGDIGVLGIGRLGDMAVLYAAVRESNSLYEQYIAQVDERSREHQFEWWNEHADRLLPQARALAMNLAQLDLAVLLAAARDATPGRSANSDSQKEHCP
jgi:hypothetical protein